MTDFKNRRMAQKLVDYGPSSSESECSDDHLPFTREDQTKSCHEVTRKKRSKESWKSNSLDKNPKKKKTSLATTELKNM